MTGGVWVRLNDDDVDYRFRVREHAEAFMGRFRALQPHLTLRVAPWHYKPEEGRR